MLHKLSVVSKYITNHGSLTCNSTTRKQAPVSQRQLQSTVQLVKTHILVSAAHVVSLRKKLGRCPWGCRGTKVSRKVIRFVSRSPWGHAALFRQSQRSCSLPKVRKAQHLVKELTATKTSAHKSLSQDGLVPRLVRHIPKGPWLVSHHKLVLKCSL